MVGRSGGAFALAGFFVAGLSTLLRLTTPFDSGLVRFAKPHKEAAIMATIPTETHPLLAVPFNAATDFTVLADHCENFAETLIESKDIALKMAICGRLNAALTLLQPTLLEPVPPHLIESLIVDTLPASAPQFGPECTELCNYCLALTQTLAEQGFSSEKEKQLSCLLYDLINYFAAEMKAPRWLRTADGVKFIDGVAA
ncbi:TPA: ash family protein [Salmonella enterica]|uniref:Ash family protein n=3 Tax=Salmonella enterica TaxID=28901 RepID=A0A753SSL4_SALER|nr:ash family protein [Salmonella enterica]HAG0973378.1 ash family protein [Salmonella enterica]HAG1012486.1 ash family protein [Salmonella enterica]HAG2885212.1 ash family protein [Salmonella enterica]HAK2890835.1 ash family protein [Salmonella enterica]